MSVNCCSNREQMSLVIQQCISSGMQDVLQIFLNDCVSKIFDDSATMTQCFKCSVQHGISQITIERRASVSPDHEFAGVR
jgi:hypothetical protein